MAERRPLCFEHKITDPQIPGADHSLCVLADLSGQGRRDIIVGSMLGVDNLVWYEYPHWQRHVLGTASLEAGGVVCDLDRDGRPDFVAGQPQGGYELYWFDCPEDPRDRWTPRVLCRDFHRYHDQAWGDLDNDGEPELLFSSQSSRVLAYYKIPDDPTVVPWPASHRHTIATDLNLHGLAIADINGDGRHDVVAGGNWFEPPSRPGQPWTRRTIGEFYGPRVVVADVNGDGVLDLVISDGERHAPGARVAWYPGPEFREIQLLADDLFAPHTLEVADFDGDGHVDLLVGEMNTNGNNPQARVFIFRGDGRGGFSREVISTGIGVHEARTLVLPDGRLPSIVGKDWRPGEALHLWENVTDR